MAAILPRKLGDRRRQRRLGRTFQHCPDIGSPALPAYRDRLQAIGNLIRGTYKSAQNTANRVSIFDWINALKMVC